MSSVTTWQRLEPMPRTEDVAVGLRAEIADPLWMLGRQRQFAEWRGEDAGSPAEARIELAAAYLDARRAGPAAADRPWVPIDLAALPLEVAVEREATVRRRVAFVIDAGLHAARLLRSANTAVAVGRVVEAYAFTAAEADAVEALAVAGRPGDVDLAVRRCVGRVIHGARLRDDLIALRDAAGEVTALPSGLTVPASAQAKVLSAFTAFLRWWDEMVSEPADPAESAWNGRRLEHQFSVTAALHDGRVELHADNYTGGRLDWYSFTEVGPLGPDEAVGLPAPASPMSIVRTLLPAPVSYPGMPAQRYWEIEDGAVRFGRIGTGRTDLARMLLAEFALTYGVDWFVIPVDVPVGTVSVVKLFRVTDTFGERTDVPVTTGRHGAEGLGGAGRGWGMFDVPTGPGRGVGGGADPFVLAPVLYETLESPPVEEVLVLRDEMANIVWGVERRYEHTTGAVVDRYEEHQRTRALAQTVDHERPDAQLAYRLATDVPMHWFPFVPVQVVGAPPGTLTLERRPLVRFVEGGTTIAPEPEGLLLRTAAPYQIEEEEVPRSGVLLTRTYQLARSPDGRYHLWSGFAASAGNGEGSSGLRFDTVERPL